MNVQSIDTKGKQTYTLTHTHTICVDVEFYVGYDDETKWREKYEGSRQQMMIILFYIKDVLFFSCVVHIFLYACTRFVH